MNSNYLQVFCSAENKLQADNILTALLKQKLVAGGMISHGPATFWWKGKLIDMDYYNVSAFSARKYQKAIIKTVKTVSVEEVPMVWFIPFEGNNEFLRWIEHSLAEK